MSLRYLTEFIRLRCAPDLLAERLFPNAKEITETMGAWNAVREHILPRVPTLRSDHLVRVFCVGDGHQPRTAALFALLTEWGAFSIDPVLSTRAYPFRRLMVKPARIEEFTYHCPSDIALTLIIHVHSHASLKTSVANITGGGTRYLVNIPCCRRPDLDFPPIIAYDDPGILSPKRRVEIYDLNT